MLDLQRPHGNTPARDLRAYVQALEAWIITALASFGLRGEVREGRVGVWVTNPQTGIEEKIAAIGVRVSRWVSWHGVALIWPLPCLTLMALYLAGFGNTA